MRDLIAAMCDRFGDETPAVFELAESHCAGFLQQGLIPVEQLYTTSPEDCAFLYLLIRQFNRRSAFEVGTYIGRSAVCMNEAVRRNGGTLTTCDPVNYGALPPWSGIRFIQGPARSAVALLAAERVMLDFCFFDWPPDDATLACLKGCLTDDAIFAVHDFGSDPKGQQVIDALGRAGLCDGRSWLLPEVQQGRTVGGINYCTAACLPRALWPH
jgi:hypothetical protein